MPSFRNPLGQRSIVFLKEASPSETVLSNEKVSLFQSAFDVAALKLSIFKILKVDLQTE